MITALHVVATAAMPVLLTVPFCQVQDVRIETGIPSGDSLALDMGSIHTRKREVFQEKPLRIRRPELDLFLSPVPEVCSTS